MNGCSGSRKPRQARRERRCGSQATNDTSISCNVRVSMPCPTPRVILRWSYLYRALHSCVRRCIRSTRCLTIHRSMIHESPQAPVDTRKQLVNEVSSEIFLSANNVDHIIHCFGFPVPTGRDLVLRHGSIRNKHWTDADVRHSGTMRRLPGKAPWEHSDRTEKVRNRGDVQENIMFFAVERIIRCVEAGEIVELRCAPLQCPSSLQGN